MSKSIYEAFKSSVEKYGNKLAVSCDDEEITYNDLYKLVNKLVSGFLSANVSKGNHVGVLLNNSAEYVATFVALAKMGCCVVPLNNTLPASAIKKSVDYADVNYLIVSKKQTENQYLDGNDLANCTIIDIDEIIDDNKLVDDNLGYELNSLDLDNEYILALTSGSTGNPKAIVLSQNNKYERAIAHIDAFGLNETDRILVTTPLYHSLAERLMFMSLILGATVVMPNINNGVSIYELLDKEDITFAISVPSQLSILLDDLKRNNIAKFDKIKVLVSSSSLLSNNLKNELIDHIDARLFEIYGMSEASTLTIKELEKEYSSDNKVGYSFAGSQIKIIRGDNNTDYDTECKTGEIGEIVCKTRLMFKGYYKQKASTSHYYDFNGYFKTGDVGFLDDKGCLHFVGRKKEIIINDSVNVYPRDIDSEIEKMPEVAECAAFAYPDERLGEIIALAIVPNEDYEISIKNIKAYCKRNLADFQQPQVFFVVDSLPKNTLGKLQRAKCYEYVKAHSAVAM